MRILVTGITGFAGGHLAEALLAGSDAEITGVSRDPEWPAPLRHLAGRIALRSGDLASGAVCRSLIEDVRPEEVFHLAGYAHAGESQRDPDAAWDGNLTATRRLYDALAAAAPRARVLYVGSGLVYGDPPGEQEAQDEQCPFRPVSPYASSKAAADLTSYQYTRSAGLAIIRARPFNHIGPRQSPQYAVAHFARQIAAIEQGRQPPVLETGNLAARRDLTDVRDVVAAYLLLMERGRSGEAYNIGSGATHSMQAILERLLSLSGARIEVHQKASLMRASEASVVRADASKLRHETGWQPRFSLDDTLAETLAYWRQALLAEG